MAEPRLKCAVLNAGVSAGRPDADAAALQDVCASIVAMAEIEHQFGGRLLEQGDSELSFRFATVDGAVEAGLNLMARSADFAVIAGAEPELRLAVIYGELADGQGDVDASAIAEARGLSGLAQPGELCLNGTAHAALSASLQSLAVARDRPDDPPEPGQQGLWVIEKPPETAALISDPEDLLHLEPVRLNVRYRGEEWEVTAAWPVLLLGRSPNADITVDDHVVSRSHARIEYRLGRFLLIDHSRNGTFIRRPSGKEVYLRQQEFALSGHGTIGLGLPSASTGDQFIEFSVTRRSSMPS
jgi:hypothetical protein